MAERLGPSLEWWLDEPWAFVLYIYLQAQERDRVTMWRARMERINLATLIGLAFNQPKGLAIEQQAALADAAAPVPTDAALARGRRMLRKLRKGKVLVS